MRVDLSSYSYFLLPYETIAKYRPDFLPKDNYPMHYDRIKKHFDLNASYNNYNYVKKFERDDPRLKKIIFFEFCKDGDVFKLPKSKLVMFKWEASRISKYWYEPFSAVYTVDDDLVDGVKFFKFYYPSLLPMLEDLPDFSERKLCTMVVSYWLKERIDMVEFFKTKPLGELDIYGRWGNGLNAGQMYKGTIPGYFSGLDKLNTLKKYKFVICFENTRTTKGYITEKIFDCFAAGCIPIYWGPVNVGDYIPENCFINYRNFKSKEELYQHIKSIDESMYRDYLDNIRAFLSSDQAQLFSPDYFDQLLFEAASR